MLISNGGSRSIRFHRPRPKLWGLIRSQVAKLPLALARAQRHVIASADVRSFSRVRTAPWVAATLVAYFRNHNKFSSRWRTPLHACSKHEERPSTHLVIVFYRTWTHNQGLLKRRFVQAAVPLLLVPSPYCWFRLVPACTILTQPLPNKAC